MQTWLDIVSHGRNILGLLTAFRWYATVPHIRGQCAVLLAVAYLVVDVLNTFLDS